MTTYFISDIHLHPNADKNSGILMNFLQTTAFNAEAIYILGDLFAIWFGDDVHMQDAYVQDLIHALRNLVTNGVPVYLIHGNRDFLLSQEFCASSGCKLLPDPCLINLYEQKILISHGDQLCTMDNKYQKFRKIVQNPRIKKFFLSLPKSIRLQIGKMVQKSSSHSSKQRYQSQPEIFDVNPETVLAWANKHQVKHIIHGHTHKPNIHLHQDVKRIVLGDWNENNIKILAVRPENEFALLDLN